MNLMVEDSKTWFEIYEVAIAVYEENDKYLNKIENNNNDPLAELSQCILDSSNGSIINVI